MKEALKKELEKLSIVFISMLALILIIFFITKIQKSKTEIEIRSMIESYLEMSLGESYTIKTKLPFSSGLSETIGFYRATAGSQSLIVSMVRITGFSGPQACLFIYNEESYEQKFISILGLYQNSNYILEENYLNYGITESILDYWMSIIQKLIYEGAVL